MYLKIIIILRQALQFIQALYFYLFQRYYRSTGFEKVIFSRLVKNIQMQGARNQEE